MALTPPSLSITLYLNDARTSLFLQDTTDLYSPTNLLGYGAPTITTNSVTTLTVTLNYTNISTPLVYNFTLVNSVITAATVTLAAGTAVNILSQLPSTAWPFTSANRFELTKAWTGLTLPSLDDMVYSVSYRIQGTYTAIVFDYTATAQELVDTVTACCLSKSIAKLDLNDITGYESALLVNGYLLTAFNANADLNTTKANQYLTMAKSLCDCGC